MHHAPAEAGGGCRVAYTRRQAIPSVAAPTDMRKMFMKKLLGIFALAGAAFAALTFWRSKQSDDDFLDEELD